MLGVLGLFPALRAGGGNLKFGGSLLAVRDVARSRKFYEELLGQKVKFDFGRDVAFEGGFTIHLSSHFQELLGGAREHPLTARPHNMELYFEAEEVEGYARKLAEAGVEFVHPVQEQPWGQLVARIYDPDGHIVEIGETVEGWVQRMHASGMTTEAIVNKTKMPREVVEKALAGR